MYNLDRSLCGDAHVSGAREWLVTNGIGGFACGTVSGMLTRRYHGLLLAALKPPLGRTLLVAKLDDTVEYDGRAYALYADRFDDGAVFPKGFKYLERFELEETIPLWTYTVADVLLEKRIWMRQGANTTYVQYRLARASLPLTLTVTGMVNYRDYHLLTQTIKSPMHLEKLTNGVGITAFESATPFYIVCDQPVTHELYGDWIDGYFLGVEQYRGGDTTEAHYHAVTFHAQLQPGQTLTFLATTERNPAPPQAALLAYEGHQQKIKQAAHPQTLPPHLALAADQFVVKRKMPDGEEGLTVIAGYPWFSDWGRDTMISLPGLTLATGRFSTARQILLTFSKFISEGMLPNRFPEENETPEYNTVDATLWYFEAMRAYFAETQDLDLIRALFPVLQDIIRWHLEGTRYQIKVDDEDGLLYAGQDDVQLTWMDVKIEDWVVTPRTGKAVEINALWYNALRIMETFAPLVDQDAVFYQSLAEKTRHGFRRFWNEAQHYCYDVLDTPNGAADSTLRPNQLFAVSLHYAEDLLTSQQQRLVVDTCGRKLLTSHGLRSLSPDDPSYIGIYGGDLKTRDQAYHQGTVWAWLIGAFVSAHYRVYKDKTTALSFLNGLLAHVQSDCLGTINEIFDGDAPHHPRGCFAQAWSVAEVLRVFRELSL